MLPSVIGRIGSSERGIVGLTYRDRHLSRLFGLSDLPVALGEGRPRLV